jgi:hypothetical protein
MYQFSVYFLDIMKALCKCSFVREVDHYHALKLCMNIVCVNNHMYYWQQVYKHQSSMYSSHTGTCINEGYYKHVGVSFEVLIAHATI